jgi:hypothetical protein
MHGRHDTGWGLFWRVQAGKPHLNYVVVFSLGRAILLVCVRARDKVRDVNLCKQGMKSFIFTSPVGLNRKNFLIK